jgi:hypothetical protein
MSLQIRRGTDAQRQAVTFDLGEILYTTDTKKLFIGDGATLGGVNVLASSAGTGLSWNSTTQTLNFSGTLSGYTTDNLAQGTVNLYYSPTRAKADIATMFTATGSSTVTGTVTATTATTISFVGAVSTINSVGILTYTSGTVPQIGMVITGTGINASPATYIVSGTSPTFILNQVPTAAGTGVAIQGVISLVTVSSAAGLVALEPFLVTGSGGGGLSPSTYYIINPSAGTNQITLATTQANAQNSVAITTLTTATLSATNFSAGGPDANVTFSYNSVTGTMSVNSAGSGLTAILQDSSPTLGGNLTLNGNTISGNGNINITGQILANVISTTLISVSGTQVLLVSNTNMRVGMPIVFGLTSQTAVTTGNIIPYLTYYVASVLAGNYITISATIGGTAFNAGTASGTMFVTANGLDTGIVTASSVNVNSMLTFRDMTYPANTTEYQISGISGYFIFGQASAPQNFVFNTNSADQPFTIRGATTGNFGNQPNLKFGSSRGTVAAPLICQNGDSIGLIKFDPYTGIASMGGYSNGAFITAYVSDSTFVANAALVNTTIAIGNDADIGTGTYTTFAPGGVVTVPVLTRNLVNEVTNFIAVGSSTTYALSTTVTNNILITSGSYTATLTFPSTGLRDGQLVKFTVAATASAFTLTLALTAGPTLIGTFAGAVATSASTATTYSYIYRASNTSWYRV